MDIFCPIRGSACRVFLFLHLSTIQKVGTIYAVALFGLLKTQKILPRFRNFMQFLQIGHFYCPTKMSKLKKVNRLLFSVFVKQFHCNQLSLLNYQGRTIGLCIDYYIFYLYYCRYAIVNVFPLYTRMPSVQPCNNKLFILYLDK